MLLNNLYVIYDKENILKNLSYIEESDIRREVNFKKKTKTNITSSVVWRKKIGSFSYLFLLLVQVLRVLKCLSLLFFTVCVVGLLMSPAEKGNEAGIPVPSVLLYSGAFSQQGTYLKRSRNVLPVCLKLLLTTWEKLKSREKNLGLSLYCPLLHRGRGTHKPEEALITGYRS